MFEKRIAFAILVVTVILSYPLCSQASTDAGNRVFPEAGRMSAENAIRRVEFTSAGMRFVTRSAGQDSISTFEFRLKAVDAGTASVFVSGPPETEPVNQENIVFYNHSGVVLEKYAATEAGVDQFILLQANVFDGLANLEISGEVATTLQWEDSPVKTFGALTLYAGMAPALRYGPVMVIDASGNQARVEIRLEGTRLTLVVPGAWLAGATYPVTIRSTIHNISDPAAKVFVGKGDSAASGGAMISNATTVTSIEDTPVFRAEFHVTMWTILNGSHFNFFEVKLNSNNSTWLYTPTRMQQGYEYTFDLVLDNVQTLSDITMLGLSKFGDSDWYIKAIKLSVNNKLVYSKYFSGQLLALEGNDVHLATSPELRLNEWWRSYTFPGAPALISNWELGDSVESIVGDYLGAELWNGWNPASLHWGYYPVGVFGNRGARQVHFLLDLDYDVYPVSAGFDLEFNCNSGKIFIAIKNLNLSYPVVNSASMTNKLKLQLFLQTSLPAIIQRDLQNVTYTNTFGQAACPVISVDNWGSVSLKN